MIKKDVTYGDWRIVRHDDSKMEVYKNGELCPKSAPALRDVAKEVGLEVNPDWRTSQLGSNVIKAVEAAQANQENNKPEMEQHQEMSFLEKFYDSLIVETEDQVYYDAWSADDDVKELFICNIKAQCSKNELALLESLKYLGADEFIKYLDEDPDELSLAQIIVTAAYCTFYSYEIDDDLRICEDFQLYYFNDDMELHYEYEADIDLG